MPFYDDPPYKIGSPWDRIVNVHWRSPLLLNLSWSWADYYYTGIPSGQNGGGTSTHRVDNSQTISTTWGAPTPIVPPAVVPNHTDIELITAQDNITLLSSNKTTFPSFTQGVISGGTVYTSQTWNSPPDTSAPPYMANYNVLDSGNSRVGGGAKLSNFTVQFIIQINRALLDTVNTNISGDISFSLSGFPSSVPGVAGTSRWGGTSIFNDINGTTVDTSSTSRQAGIIGSQASNFSTALYSGKDFKYDPGTKSIVPRDPSKNKSVLSSSNGGGALAPQGLSGPSIAVFPPGMATFHIATKSVLGNIVPVVWVDQPSSSTTYGWFIPGLGSFFTPFGTPP